MKDRDLILHRMCDIARDIKSLRSQFREFYAADDAMGGLRVHMGEAGFRKMFPDAKDFEDRKDGTYELYTIVDGVRFFCLTDEVADDA